MLQQTGRRCHEIDMGIPALFFTVFAGVCSAVILDYMNLLWDDLQLLVQVFLPDPFQRMPAAAAGRLVFGQLQDNPPAQVKKIGKMTYIVRIHFSETSTETMEDKIKRMLKNEVRQMMENE